MKKQSLFLFSLLVSVILVAQSPQRFSYQALIRDAQSALVKNKAIGARFTLLQGSLTGEVMYVETQTVLSNSNGLITPVSARLIFRRVQAKTLAGWDL